MNIARFIVRPLKSQLMSLMMGKKKYRTTSVSESFESIEFTLLWLALSGY